MASESSYPEGYESLPAQAILMEKDITMKGWMLKKSGREKIALSPAGQYDKRFFIILRGWVYYYKDECAEKPQNSFSLEGYSNHVTLAEEEKSKSIPYVFKVYPRNKKGRTWYLATENQQLMNEWRDAFRFEIDRFNMKSPGSKLTGSFSLPEKTNHRRNAAAKELDQGRSMSVSGSNPKRNMVSKNSITSSQSSESRESLSSFPPEDRHLQSNLDQYYEPLDSDIAEEWHRQHPVPSPPSSSYPHVSLPMIPSWQSSPPDDPNNLYDVIDDENVKPTGTFFQNHSSPSTSSPLPPPLQQKPQHLGVILQEKLPLSRVSSIPSQAPPEPPSNSASYDPEKDYEEPEFVHPRFSTFRDKPLPPVPLKDDANTDNPPMYADTAAETEDLTYESTIDDRSRVFTLPIPSKTVSPRQDEFYDDTLNLNNEQPRHNTISAINESILDSKGLQPTPFAQKPLSKIPPKLPSAGSKPKLSKAETLPLKPSMLKSTENRITSPPSLPTKPKPVIDSSSPLPNNPKPNLIVSSETNDSKTRVAEFASPLSTKIDKPQTPQKTKVDSKPKTPSKPNFSIDKTDTRKPCAPPVSTKPKPDPSPKKTGLDLANSEVFSKARSQQSNVTSPIRNVAKPVGPKPVGPKPGSSAASGKASTLKVDKKVSDDIAAKHSKFLSPSNSEPELLSVSARIKKFGVSPTEPDASPKPPVSMKPQFR